MIEIICKDDPAKDNHNKDTICLPKNIRQEGSPRGRHKIYLEDYVYTYLRNMAKEKEACAAVFLGKSQVEKDIRYTFISGLVECGAAVFQWDAICLDDSFWDYIFIFSSGGGAPEIFFWKGQSFDADGYPGRGRAFLCI